MGIEKMTRGGRLPFLWLGALCLGIILTPTSVPPVEKGSRSPYVILSGEFFAALQKLAKSGEISGDRQEPLLEQIALSGQYTVKTNLILIQQNERIIRLLEELIRNRPATER
uniref:Uncharacterized protein n=1 Tax=Desulfobacca acetoxidans TaxID=60893 RepID=A0A7C3WS10_9BACT